MAREIDDIAKRKQYREEQFDGKRSTTDEYRGGRIFSGNSPSASYKHPIEKLTDNDHITPLEVVAERYPNLSKEQQKQIANQYYNLALTNSKLNRSKGALENHEYLQRQFKTGQGVTLLQLIFNANKK